MFITLKYASQVGHVLSLPRAPVFPTRSTKMGSIMKYFVSRIIGVLVNVSLSKFRGIGTVYSTYRRNVYSARCKFAWLPITLSYVGIDNGCGYRGRGKGYHNLRRKDRTVLITTHWGSLNLILPAGIRPGVAKVNPSSLKYQFV